MKKIFAFLALLTLTNLTSWSAQGEELPAEEFRPEELVREISLLHGSFEKEARKPVDQQNTDALLPRAMYLLGVAQDILKDQNTRIPLLVKLAIATIPFDETVAAADVLTEDYKKHTAAYDTEIEKQPREEARNRLRVSLRRYANFNPDAPEIIGVKNTSSSKNRKKK